MQDNLAVETTRLCDKACLHCGSYGKFTEAADLSSMPMSMVRKVVKQADWTNKNRRMTNIKIIHLTGGEPFMWQHNGHKTGAAVEAIQKHGFEPQILTSGTVPSDKGYERYMEGAKTIDGLPSFNVFHSYNQYMAGADINTRLLYTIGLFDEILGHDRELGFFGVYDRSNRGATLDGFDDLMSKVGFRLMKSESTRNWKEKSRQGKDIELVYKNGDRVASVEFSTVDKCAGRARISKLHPIRVNKGCYIIGDKRGRHRRGEGIQPVVGYNGNVYPCWAGPYPDTRPLGNINDDHLSTILGREKAYLAEFGACVRYDWNRKTDICGFCVNISKPCLS